MDLDVEGTRDRFNRRQAGLSKRGYGAMAEGSCLTETFLPRLVPIVEKNLESCGHRVGTNLGKILKEIGAKKLAAAALDTLPDSILRRIDEPKKAKSVKSPGRWRTILVDQRRTGNILDLGTRAQELDWETSLDRKTRKRLRKAQQSNRARRAIAHQAGYRKANWDTKRRGRVGLWLLDCCLELNDVFILVEGTPQITRSVENLVLNAAERRMWGSPVYRPSKSQPSHWMGWARDNSGSPFPLTFLRSGHAETRRGVEVAFADGGIKPHGDAVNALQSVAFCINEPVLEALELEAKPLIEEAARKFEQTKNRKDRAVSIGKGTRVDYVTLENDINTARSLVGTPFYIALNCDWRGRITPLPHFHYQRADYIRGLFMFDQGLPVGENGIARLREHLAGCLGVKDTWGNRHFNARTELYASRAEAEAARSDPALRKDANKRWLDRQIRGGVEESKSKRAVSAPRGRY